MPVAINILTKPAVNTNEPEKSENLELISGASVAKLMQNMDMKEDSSRNPAAIILLDKHEVIMMMEGSELETLNLNKYELIGGQIHENFKGSPLILYELSKAVSKRLKFFTFSIKNKTYDIFLTYTYKKKSELSGIIIVVIESLSERNEAHENIKSFSLHLFEKSPDAIVLLDSEDNIVKANSSFEKLFGYENHFITGENIYGLIQPEHLRVEIREIKEALKGGAFIELDTERINSKGDLIEITMTSFETEINGDKKFSCQIFKETASSRHHDDQMRSSLLEKEMLLKEIHHRVKNNLQIVSSLLFLQAKSINDEKTIDILLESHNRVKSISLIHEKLYQSSNISRIDFDRYLHSLIPHLLQTFGKTNGSVIYNIKGSNIFLSPDTAIPCALIINEIITNSLKYAFNDCVKGEISVELIYHNDNNLSLIIKDNGKGLPERISFSNPKTLGLQLIKLLVKQLSGSIELINTKGTAYKITFPFKEYKLNH